MLIPIFRFLNRPLKMFYFGHARLGHFRNRLRHCRNVFSQSVSDVCAPRSKRLLEGAVVYGVCAVGSWVGGMVLLTRQHRVAPRRRRSDFFTTHHQ